MYACNSVKNMTAVPILLVPGYSFVAVVTVLGTGGGRVTAAVLVLVAAEL